MTQQPKPQIKIGDTITVINYNTQTRTFYVDLDYVVTQAETIQRLVSDLRWQRKTVKLLNHPDDGKIDVCFIFAWKPEYPDSEDVWMARSEKLAEAKVEQLKAKYPEFQRWRLEACRIEVAAWQTHWAPYSQSTTTLEPEARRKIE